jgi:hypothetical protein
LQEQVTGCAADLVVVGHTHWPLNRHIETDQGLVHVVNLGSISNPQVPDRAAWYAILEADKHGYQLRQHCVAYDHEAVIAALAAARHPAPAFIERHLRGEYARDWPLPPVTKA